MKKREGAGVMLRRLRMVGCLVSLFLCLALIFLWGRSTRGADHVFYAVCRPNADAQTLTLYGGLSRAGSLGLWVCREQRNPAARELPASWWQWSEAARDRSSFPPLNRLGFALGRSDTPSANTRDFVAMVPHWLLALLTAAAPLAALGRLGRRYARACRGLCLDCGYDLRGTTGRCPECGTESPPRVPKAAA